MVALGEARSHFAKGLAELPDLIVSLRVPVGGHGGVVAQLHPPSILREAEQGLGDGVCDRKCRGGGNCESEERDGEEDELQPSVGHEFGVEPALEEHGGLPVLHVQPSEERDEPLACHHELAGAVER